MPNDPINHLMFRMGRCAYAHPKPWKLIFSGSWSAWATQARSMRPPATTSASWPPKDVFQPVMSSGAAAGADAQLSQRQRHVIGNHQHMIRRYLVNPTGTFLMGTSRKGAGVYVIWKRRLSVARHRKSPAHDPAVSCKSHLPASQTPRSDSCREKKTVDEAVGRAVDAALCVMEKGVSEAQNLFN